MTKYRTGVRIEHKARRFLRGEGYAVLRSAGSKGVFDLVAIDKECVRLIQCKSGTHIPSFESEIQEMAEYCAPSCCTKELWVYRKNFGWDNFVVLGDGKVKFPGSGKITYVSDENIAI